MIVLDNCVPRRYLRLLHEWGYDAILMTDEIPADATDTKVVALARRLDAVLLTVDLDFSNILDYPPQNYQGIIVLRYHIRDEAAIDNSLKITLEDLYREELRGCLVIVTSERYRLRKG